MDIWLSPEEQTRHTIQDRKMTLTIASNPLGFYLLDSLPKSEIFDEEYHRDNILSVLLPLRPQVDGRKFIVHANDPSPHTSGKCTTFCAENALRLSTHPPYSSALAPSDFFLSEHVNIACKE
jgi:hypothetical protein